MRNSRVEPDQIESTACWTWTGKVKGRYPRLNIRVHGKVVEVRAHRLMLALMMCEGEPEVVADLYAHLSASGLEADHLCEGNPLCINPDHLQWIDPWEHFAKTYEARYGRPPPARSQGDEFDDERFEL